MADPIIKVTSRSFSTHPLLRCQMSDSFPGVVFNKKNRIYGEEDLSEYIKDADGAVVGLEQITDNVLEACPNLKIVAKFGVGLDNVDREACRRRGVTVGWTGGVNRRGVAEMTLCFMIGLSRNIFFSASGLRAAADWSKLGGADLSGKIVGIIGAGYIGKEVIRMLQPFGCKILVNDILDQSDYYRSAGVTESSKENIYTSADIISIHTTLEKSTRHMIDVEVLSKMKETAYLINVARGGIVDQNALKIALRERQIAAAAVDVFEVEPCDDQDFLNLPNLYCTPHTGGSSAESILAMGRSAIGHLVNYFH